MFFSSKVCQSLLLSCNKQIEKFLIWKVHLSVMAKNESKCFTGHLDRYNGVTVNSIDEPCDISVFPQFLQGSLQEWMKNRKNTIWFNVNVAQAEWIPILTKANFKFHHAKEDNVMLYKWLSEENCNIPPYAHTNIGIGAFVYNEKTQEILVVKQQKALITMWKLPGGYVEPNENLDQAVEREVLEETGIVANFKCLLTFRHSHHWMFDCSDMYFIAHLIPENHDIKKCTQEIYECVWMKLEEFAEHPEVHSNNRFFAQKMLEHLKTNVGLTAIHSIHPTIKKPICTFALSEVNSNN